MVYSSNIESVINYNDDKLLSPEKYSLIAKEYFNELQKFNLKNYGNIKPVLENLLEYIGYIINFSNHKLKLKKFLYIYYKDLTLLYKDIFNEEYNFKKNKPQNINIISLIFNLIEVILSDSKILQEQNMINLLQTLHNFLKNMLI